MARRKRGQRERAQQKLAHTHLIPNCKGSFHGGKREGAGRPKTGRRVGVVHRRRQDVRKGIPVHVTTRTVKDVGYLRTNKVYRVIRQALARGCQRRGFRVTQFSLQRNHLHLVIEADSAAQLHKGMTGLLVRMARGLNRLRGRKGQVFPDRFHHRVMKTPTQVRNTLCYVLNNAKRHAHEVQDKHRMAPRWMDPFSSAGYFDGWARGAKRLVPSPAEYEEPPVAAARSWLLTTGWRRRGLIAIGEMPKGH